MTASKVALKQKKEVAEGTMAFHFERPVAFEFKAGQFLNYTLIDPPETDVEGNLRSFSIASAPWEADLMLATRMRDIPPEPAVRLSIGSAELNCPD